MKRFFCVLLSVALIMGLSVSAFADFDSERLAYKSDKIIDLGDGVTYFGTFATSELDSAGRSFMSDFFGYMTGFVDSTDYHYIFCDKAAASFWFVKVPDGNKFSFFKNVVSTNSIYDCLVAAVPFVSSSSTSRLACEAVRFTYSSSDSLFHPYKYSGQTTHVYSTSSMSSSKLYWTSLGEFSISATDTDCIVWTNDGSVNSKHDWSTSKIAENNTSYVLATPEEFEIAILDFPVGLGFVDDDGLIESVTPEPEDPEDPEDVSSSDGGADEGSAGGTVGGGSDDDSSSSIPEQGTGESSSGQITLPKIENNAVIPYDLDVWNVVLDATLPTLRKVFSIGFPLFLIFLGVQVMLGLIRKFALSWLGGSHRGGGGNIKHD